MIAHACNYKTRHRKIVMSSNPAWATKWDPVSKNQKQQQSKIYTCLYGILKNRNLAQNSQTWYNWLPIAEYSFMLCIIIRNCQHKFSSYIFIKTPDYSIIVIPKCGNTWSKHMYILMLLINTANVFLQKDYINFHSHNLPFYVFLL